MAAVTIHIEFGAQENEICHCFHYFPMYLPWNDGTGCQIFVFECWVLSQLFHSPLLPSSRGSLVALSILPLKWCHLHVWGCGPDPPPRSHCLPWGLPTAISILGTGLWALPCSTCVSGEILAKLLPRPPVPFQAHGPVLFILLFTISLLPRRAQQSGANLSKFSDVLALLFIGMYYYLYFKLNSHSYMYVKL